MKAGTGFSDNASSVEAGAEAARGAMAALGDGGCDLVMLFSTSQHDPALLREGVRSVVGPGPRLMGGWAVGVITNDRFGYGGSQVAVACLRFDGVQWDVIAESGLAGAQEQVGKALGARLRQTGDDDRCVVMVYDKVDRTTGRMRWNMATPLLAGLEAGYGGFPTMCGAGMAGDMVGSPTWQWFDDQLSQQTALGLTMWGGIRMDTVVMHGCEPASSYRRITKADGPTILEIDGIPAVDAVAEMLGDHDVGPEGYGFFVTLGINTGDKWGEFQPEAYVNRLCVRVDKQRGGLVMLEPDMPEGMDVQLMYRSIDLDYMAPRIESAFAQLNGRRPVFALYLDCAGRAAAYSGAETEDAIEVQRTVAGRVPLLGLYTAVEIGEILGRPRPLDWTGVFCLFSVPAP